MSSYWYNMKKKYVPTCGFYFIELIKSTLICGIKFLLNMIYIIGRYLFDNICKFNTNVSGICQHILYVLALCKVKSKDPVSCTWSIATN